MNILENRQNYFPMNTPSYNQAGADKSLLGKIASMAAKNNQVQQSNQMQGSGSAFADWARQRPGTMDAMSRGGNYDGWNAMADIIGAYWANRPVKEGGGDAVGGNTAAVIDSLGGAGGLGGSLGNSIGSALGNSIGSAAGSALGSAGSAIGAASGELLPGLLKGIGGLGIGGMR